VGNAPSKKKGGPYLYKKENITARRRSGGKMEITACRQARRKEDARRLNVENVKHQRKTVKQAAPLPNKTETEKKEQRITNSKDVWKDAHQGKVSQPTR